MSPIINKTYATGEVIIASEPLVHVLNSYFKGTYCDNCLAKNEKLKKCSQCKSMYYCDRKCQQFDWKCHKLECDIYSEYDVIQNNSSADQKRLWLMVDNDSLFRILMRLWLLIKSDDSISNQLNGCHNGQQRCLNDLISHATDIKNDSIKMLVFRQMIDKFVDYGVDVNSEKLLRLFGQIAVNGYEYKRYDVHEFADYSRKFLGFGLFISMSIFNHSCEPNAAYVNFGKTMQIRATRPVAANETIFIDYIPLERCKSERTQILKSDWFFDCRCHKCESIEDERVNYKLLSNLTNNVKDRQKSYLTEQRLTVLRQIYPHYHPAYSFYLLAHMFDKIKISNNKGMRVRDELKDLVLQVFKNLSITHGREHQLFQFFQQITSF